MLITRFSHFVSPFSTQCMTRNVRLMNRWVKLKRKRPNLYLDRFYENENENIYRLNGFSLENRKSDILFRFKATDNFIEFSSFSAIINSAFTCILFNILNLSRFTLLFIDPATKVFPTVNVTRTNELINSFRIYP